MNDHDKRVKSLIKYMQEKGFVIEMAALSDYQEPIPIGRHEPDVIGKSATAITIGEAKTEDDYKSEHSLEQYEDFGKSKASIIYLHLPLKFHAEVRLILTRLGVISKYSLLFYTSEKNNRFR